MSKVDNAISSTLGVTYEPEPTETGILVIKPLEGEILPPEDSSKPPVDPRAPHEDEDYTLARGTLQDLIKKGSASIDQAIHLAEGSEKPEAWKALSLMLTAVSDLTTKLYDLQDRAQRVKQVTDPKPENNVTVHIDQAAFVGTTAELLKTLKEAKKLATE